MIVAIIPARGGSKRLPQKNILPLAGKPLLVYTIDAVLDVMSALNVFVSTEDEAIADIATNAGAEVVRRPARIASDTATTEMVLLHALKDPRVVQTNPKWILTLPPTSPLRDAQILRAFLNQTDINAEDVDCYFSVTETHGDFWQVDNHGYWTRLFPNAPRRQQDRKPIFDENSAIYLTRISALRSTSSILGDKAVGISIPRDAAIDINDQFDFEVAECLLRRRLAR